MSAPAVTPIEKQKEAERELAMRRNVYPKWIAGGRMSHAQAERHMAIMQAIADDYRQQVEAQKGGGGASWLKD